MCYHHFIDLNFSLHQQQHLKYMGSWASAAEGREGAGAPPKHGTNIADRGLKVLFSAFFVIFRSFFPLSPVEEAKYCYFSIFFCKFSVFFSVTPPSPPENFLPTPLYGVYKVFKNFCPLSVQLLIRLC